MNNDDISDTTHVKPSHLRDTGNHVCLFEYIWAQIVRWSEWCISVRGTISPQLLSRFHRMGFKSGSWLAPQFYRFEYH